TERREPRERRPEPQTAPQPAAPAPPAQAQPAAAAEGPGQRSRRRRRRRGRRGGGSAAAIMAGGEAEAPGSQETGADSDQGDEEFETTDGDPATEASIPPVDAAVPSQSAADSPVDQRLTRPEPIEQAFGTGTHSAERTASDPAPAPEAPAAPRGDSPD